MTALSCFQCKQKQILRKWIGFKDTSDLVSTCFLARESSCIGMSLQQLLQLKCTSIFWSSMNTLRIRAFTLYSGLTTEMTGVKSNFFPPLNSRYVFEWAKLRDGDSGTVTAQEFDEQEQTEAKTFSRSSLCLSEGKIIPQTHEQDQPPPEAWPYWLSNTDMVAFCKFTMFLQSSQ